MRHAHLGLSIPDFPLAYGKILPNTDANTIDQINEARLADSQMPTTSTQIWLQMAHRVMAFIILGAIITVAVIVFSNPIARSASTWSMVWLVMILCQVGLGAWTIWSNKAADVATAHMALGALSLLVGVLFTFRLFRASDSGRFTVPDNFRNSDLARVA
jgi:cytochrome c oxidase assembly protein subunit 15